MKVQKFEFMYGIVGKLNFAFPKPLIDLHQPISNKDKTLWIVQDGTIYNKESILHLYEEYGQDCLKYLRGMFAFAIWDKPRKKLFLARDRLGKKPLYYYSDSQSLIFASEIKAILEDPKIERKVNYKALHYYLTYDYVPGPLTAFQNIFKLPPAHFLTWQNGRFNIKRYWQLNYGPKLNLSERDCCQEILSRLEEAVKIRMRSDAPLGAFLSGGADSSAIVALMSKFSQTPVKTFSIGFEDTSDDELPYARIIAKQFKTEHHEFLVEAKALEVLPKLVWHYGEPFADSSALPVFYVAKMAKDYVKVALNGDGGDENFGGYRRYYFDRWFKYVHKLPHKFIKFIPYTRSSRVNLFLQKAKVLSETASSLSAQRHLWLLYWFNYGLADKLYSQDFKERIKEYNPLKVMIESYKNFATFNNSLDNMMSVEINTYLPDDLLVKMEVACRANSLEARSPLLDHTFMEFTARLPGNFKIKGRQKKYIFKKALEGLLPKEIIYRRKKGFAPPVDDWFRNQMKDYAYEILLDSKTIGRNYFKKEGVEKLLKDHCQSKLNYGESIWALIFLELWHRTFIDK